MCMYEPTRISPVNEEIVCYKCLSAGKDGQYQSPNYPAKWSLNQANEISGTNTLTTVSHGNEKLHMIDGGAFHAYKHVEDALTYGIFRRLSVVKCIIPKDAKFVYEGQETTWDTNMRIKYADGYASNKLVPIEVIDKFDNMNYQEYQSLVQPTFYTSNDQQYDGTENIFVVDGGRTIYSHPVLTDKAKEIIMKISERVNKKCGLDNTGKNKP